ncbi:MAG: D-sedoheptulose 7-phosphate isomerase [Candidatus Zixiibacteriota bacterium]|jgi:D-sedoheptulose 7-phosphate isomerase
MYEEINRTFVDHITLVETVKKELGEAILSVANQLTDALDRGNTIFLCGNGGSAADAQHLAAEFTGRFLRDRRPLPAVALTTDTSALTAIGNDFGFDAIFERQVRALAKPGDVLIGISTSGNSKNVIEALKTAREIGCVTVALLGGDGGAMKANAEHVILVPSNETPRVQEVQIIIGHILCDLVDRHFAQAAD